MSANLLQHPGKMHTLTDDLESFLHVLGWTTLRYLPAMESYEAEDRTDDLEKFDEQLIRKGRSDRGGLLKSYALGLGQYPSTNYQPIRKTPLSDLIAELSLPFKSFYSMRPPTAEERKKTDIPLDYLDRERLKLFVAIDQYDQDMGRLQTSTWYIDTMNTSLDGDGWLSDDEADEELPIDVPRATKRQVQNKTNQRLNTQNMWVSSKGLPSSSKRAASPTPERSAKRQRGTPAASESGI